MRGFFFLDCPMRMNGTHHVLEAMPFRTGQVLQMPSGEYARLLRYNEHSVSLRYFSDEDGQPTLMTRAAFQGMVSQIQPANEG
ncbi:hypothetical protein DKK66_19955 (plasmid) [Aquitalea sp. USM4]|nr:hypothetical protein DKK66_19955 [Aquitalea sp. USM4]